MELRFLLFVSCLYGVCTAIYPKKNDKGENVDCQEMETTENNTDLLGESLFEANHSVDKLGESLNELTISRNDSVDPLGESLLDPLGESLLDPLGESLLNCSSISAAKVSGNDDQGEPIFPDPYDFSDNEVERNVDMFTQRMTSTPKKTTNLAMRRFAHDEEMDIGQQHSLSLITAESLDLGDHEISKTELKVVGSLDSLENKMLEKALLSAAFCTFQARNCKMLCLKNIDPSFVRSARYRLWTKDFEGRVDWFCDKFLEARKEENGMMYLCDGGKTVCSSCFRILYRLDKNFYFKYIKKFEDGAVSSGFRNGRSYVAKTNAAVDWLNDYVRFHGDWMPDKNTIMLSYKTRKIDTYSLYKAEQTEEMIEFISKSHFYEMWKTKFDHVKIKQTNSFSKCGTCTVFERQLEATRDQNQRQYIKKMILRHQRHQMQERKYYYEKRMKAVKYKDQFMSLIIDGMDQVKTNLPHFTGRSSKSLDVHNLLQTHVQGVINHGLNRFSKYIDINEYCHDSNMVMNTLLKEIHEASLLMGNKLPEVLFLQADNCYRENKNKFMLGFCELLVWKKIFKEVHLSFLIVGHTHEDIDAGFSKISDTLRRNDAGTLPKLMELIPTSRRLHGLFDIKEWITPCLNKITHHTKPQHFKFTLGANNKVVSEYRGSCRKPWVTFSHNILHRQPQGNPKIIVPPNFHKYDLDALKKNIERSRFLFTDPKEESDYKWWKKFLSTLTDLKTSKPKRQSYAKLNGKW